MKHGNEIRWRIFPFETVKRMKTGEIEIIHEFNPEFLSTVCYFK